MLGIPWVIKTICGRCSSNLGSLIKVVPKTQEQCKETVDSKESA